MRDTRILMGMPITVEIAEDGPADLVDRVFDYFCAVDERFSTFRPDSEISRFNRGRIAPGDLSPEMQEVLAIAERTRQETGGYFDIRREDGSLDPSGIVKGWAIRNAAALIKSCGVANFFVDAGGDIQAGGRSAAGEDWRVGIRSPFNDQEIIKVILPKAKGVATSGTYARGQHIYDPLRPGRHVEGIVSLTVIGPDVLEADRFATAAFAMGGDGIYFVEEATGLEGYAVDDRGMARQTSGFAAYVAP